LADVLVVCTANVARSPLFAARLQMEADGRLGPGAVTIASAGVDALFGEPAANGARVVSARWGRSLEEHHATPVTHHDLDALPLILTMERAHRRDLIGRLPSLAARCFTVRELATIVAERLDADVQHALPVAGPSGARERLRAAASLADAHRPRLFARRRTDVPDPIGAGQPVYDALGEDFAAAAAVLAPVLFGPG
jgi:protein-tyrosine phosphatase